MRSKSEKRKESKRKYGSARERADKKQVSERGPYLKIPDGVKMFQPKEGTMNLDILPYVAGKGNPCAEVGVVWYERTFFVHRGVGANSEMYLCPRKTAKHKCPICEHREKLIRKGSEDEDLIKDLAPKERQLFNVKNLKEPDKGVQLWEVSFHLFGKFLDARIRNAEEEDNWDTFFLPEGGKSLRVTFAEESFGGRSFQKCETIDFKDRKEDYDEDEILDETQCLDDLLVESSYEDMKKAFLQTEEEDEDEDEEEDEEDEDEEEEAPKKKGKKPAKEEEEEDEDEEDADEEDADEEDEEEDEDEDEEPPKKKGKKKPSEDEDEEDADEEEEEEDEEDEDADEEDEEEEEKPSKKPAKKKPAAEEEEEDWEDFDEDEEEEEDEKPVKKKKK